MQAGFTEKWNGRVGWAGSGQRAFRVRGGAEEGEGEVFLRVDFFRNPDDVVHLHRLEAGDDLLNRNAASMQEFILRQLLHDIKRAFHPEEELAFDLGLGAIQTLT